MAEKAAAIVSEEEIIRRVICGEKDLFRELVLRHQDMVFAMIMRQVSDREVAKELAQDSFMKAYLGLKSFRLQSSFSTWLVRIALNTTHSYFSSKRYKENLQAVSFSTDSLQMPNDDIEEKLEQEAKLSAMRTHIQMLPVRYRETLVLCGLEGKSYEEAASVLEIPIGTVRSRLNMARNLLKNRLFGKLSEI